MGLPEDFFPCDAIADMHRLGFIDADYHIGVCPRARRDICHVSRRIYWAVVNQRRVIRVPQGMDPSVAKLDAFVASFVVVP